MKRKADFLMEHVGGEYLLVPLGAQVVDMNGLIVLNDTGAYLWELLEQDRTVHELATALAERFDVSIETARSDVEIFLDEIDQLGLLE